MKNKATSIQNHKTPFKILCVIFLFIGYNNLHAQCTPVYTDVYDTLNCGEVLYGHNSAGLYRDTSTTTGGCDSIRVLHLDYNDPNTLPNSNWFNTANNGMGGEVAIGDSDLHWKWSPNIIGPYNPVRRIPYHAGYSNSPWANCDWISINSTGWVDATGNQNYFYKVSFGLPCFNSCGVPLDLDSSFCLSLDFFADNSVHEIYVNGIAQSPNLGGIIPNGNYSSDGYSTGQQTAVTLCQDWHPGINTLTIEILDNGGWTAFLCQAQATPPVINNVTAGFKDTIICSNTVNFTNQSTEADSYLWDFGDEIVSSVVNPSHIYDSSGSYPVKLIAYKGLCTDTIQKNVTVNFNPVDFVWSQDCGNGYPMQFNTALGNSYNWDFGDGANSTQQNPNHTYTSAGNYTPTLTFTDSNGCIDSITKSITLNDLNFTISNDTTICLNDNVQLYASMSNALSYEWEADPTLSDTTIANPIATPNSTTTYILHTTYLLNQNLVENGDFEQGDTGFSTEYALGAGGLWGALTLPGTYAITTNPHLVHNDFWNCTDHTPAPGQNEMVVNGSGVPGKKVWCQSIAVSPNTNYEFSTWVTSVINDPAVAQLQFTINGNPLGAIFAPSAQHCDWSQFFEEWNSGINTTIDICITNLNIVDAGNDFAIDDISFYQICERIDSVEVTVNPLPTATVSGTTAICLNSTEPTLTFTGANGTAPYTFSYTINGGATQNATSTGDTAIITVPTSTAGTYTYNLLSVQDASSTACLSTVTGQIAMITVNPLPNTDFTWSQDCGNGYPVQFNTALGNSYNWDFGDGANSTQQNPNHTYTSAGNYTPTLTFTDNNGCIDSITKSITLNDLNFTISNDTTVCLNDNVPLYASMSNALSYEWEADPTLSDTAIANPVATPNATTTYVLHTTYLLNQNLVENGDFEQGNTGFLSSYLASPPNPLGGPGNYTVSADITNGWWANCGDHTSGTGNMLIADGASGSNTGSSVWCQTIAISPNTDYAFSTWLTNSNALGSTSALGFFINGFQIGPTQSTQIGVCQWNQFYVVWNSGNATTINICISEMGGAQPGNDFAIDDISFYKICERIDSVQVIVNPLPTATVSGTTAICLNSTEPTITFTGANGTAPYTFSYTINGGATQTVTSTGDTAIITVPTTTVGTTTYNLVSVEDASSTACLQNQTGVATITVNSLPTVNAGTDQAVCEGASVTLSGSGANTYTWDNGVIDGVAFTSTVGTTIYTVTCDADTNGCKNSDSVKVTVKPNPIIAFDADKKEICEGLAVVFTNQSSGGNLVNCVWDLGDGTTIDNCGTFPYIYHDAGIYTVTLTTTTQEGCFSSLTQAGYIYVETLPVADFTATPSELTTMNTEVEFTNSSVGATSYLWIFGDKTPSSTVINPTHIFPNDEGKDYTIMLVAYSPLSCVDTTYRTIRVKEELIFYIPNTFTPDGNKFNEIFKPVFTSGFDPYSYTLFIFNRWGEIMFESHNTNSGWNGTYGGKVVADGTYIWEITFKSNNSDEKTFKTGHVNVLR